MTTTVRDVTAMQAQVMSAVDIIAIINGLLFLIIIISCCNSSSYFIYVNSWAGGFCAES